MCTYLRCDVGGFPLPAGCCAVAGCRLPAAAHGAINNATHDVLGKYFSAKCFLS